MLQDLVVGDIVLLESGSRVPADLRILDTDSLKVENSSFTGEPEPVELTTEMTDDVRAAPTLLLLRSCNSGGGDAMQQKF